jgi:hypothetical protein
MSSSAPGPTPTASPSSIVPNGPNNGANILDRILKLFAEQLSDAPGALRLARLARTAKKIPEPLLADIEELVLQVDDPQFVGDDVAVHILDIGFCDARCANATEFATALKTRLQRYASDPRVASNARCILKERVSWWRMALSRAGGLCRWPTIVLRETTFNG